MQSVKKPALHYALRLEPDLKNFTFKGEVTVTLPSAVVDGTAVRLDASELQVFTCKVRTDTPAGGTWRDSVFEVKTAEGKLVVQIPDELAQQKAALLQLQISYAGSINDSLAGFYRSQYLYQGEKQYLAVTQFEEQEARRALPCFDHPSYKALFDIEFLIPEELQGLANTELVQELKQAGNKKLLRFATTPPMSTYLLFFGVGDFEIKEKNAGGRRFRIITTPGKTQYGDFGLDFSIQALRYGEEYTDIPFPIGKLDLIAVPDFAYGAMENYGAVTFRENLLLVYPGITSKAGFERIAEIIAHELAHMWFGNLVTPKDWRFIWLNESFATIFGFIIADHYFPEWEMGETFVSTVTSRAMSRDALLETIPVELPQESKIVINTATAPIVYSKGACILRMLQGYLGEEAFKKGTRHFLKTFAFDCASSDEYWQTFGAATGIPLQDIMAGWIHKPGFPLVKVKREGDSLLLSQQRFTYLPNKAHEATWWIPLNILLLDETGSVLKVEKFILKEQSARLALSVQAAHCKVNPEQTGFFVTGYEKTDFHKLGKLVAAKKLSALDRYGLHNDFHALLLAGSFSLRDYLEFLEYYSKEDSFHPLINISQALAHLYLVLDDKRPALAACGQRLFAHVLAEVGLEPRPEERHTVANLRDALIWNGFQLGDERISDFAASQFGNWLKGTGVHPDILASVLKTGARLEPARAYATFIDRLESDHTAEHEKINILSAMGCFMHEEYLGKALDYTLAHVPSKNKYLPIFSAGLNPYARAYLWSWYKNNLAALEQFYPIHYERVIIGIIPYTGVGHAEEVKAFFESYPLKEQYRDTIRMALELLTINNNLKKREDNM